MNRVYHRVSVKIALINRSGDKVLMTCLRDGGFGLPGGHIEVDETPEQALNRELREELGIVYGGMPVKVDFWRDPRTERILLGFMGELDESTPLLVNQDEMIRTYWASLADFDGGKVTTITYEPFIRRVLAKKA